MTLAVEFYLDSGLKKKIPQDSHGNISLDFIDTPIGQEAKATVFAKNMAEDPIQLLEPFTTDPRFSIIEYDGIIAVGGVGKITLVFSDPEQKLRGLKTQWGFKRVLIG